MADLHHDEHHEGTGFERTDLGSRPIFGFLISLVVVGVLIYYIIWGMFYFLDAYNRKNEPAVNPMVKAEKDTRVILPGHVEQVFPEPRLETNERTELAPFRSQEEEQLNSYGWVDQHAGVVHIPIERAMQLIAQRGLPTTPQAGTVPLSPVNLAKAAAAAADTSNMPAANQKGKGTKQ